MQAPALKVLMLNYEYPPLGGGAANANYYLIQELAKYDPNLLKVDLVTSHNKAKIKTEAVASTVKIHFLPVKKKQLHYWTEREILSFSWQAYSYLKKLLTREKFDLCHVFFALPCGWLASRFRASFPYIVSLRGSDVPGFNQRLQMYNWFLRPLFRKVLNKAAAVIANSEDLKALALKSWSGKIEVIPNGVDSSQFTPNSQFLAKENNGFLKILTVSRLIERKNLDLLIKALALTSKELNWQLQVVGTGKLEKKLRQLVKDLGLEQKVKFIGYISHEQLPNYYQQADLFVLASENEGMSNALLEAMACGLPVLVKETGEAKKLVTGNGLIFQQKDPKLLAKLLTNLLSNKRKLKAMGQLSLRLAKNYSWSEVAKAYTALYGKVKREYGN